jgi:hypothetical protein
MSHEVPFFVGHLRAVIYVRKASYFLTIRVLLLFGPLGEFFFVKD